MQIASLVNLSAMPNISSLIGTQGSRRVIESINASGGGVYFGSQIDPFADNYARFNNIYATALNVKNELQQSHFYIVGMNEILPITCAENLIAIPPIMHVPILTFEPIRQFYNDGAIEGWGIDLPKEVEDVTGRLIDNGLIEPRFDEKGNYTVPDELVWEDHYDDPDYSDDELNALDDTRRFFIAYLKEQLQPGASRRDPTSLDGGIIGKLK